MKMSDYFNLPIDSTCVVAINHRCTIQDNNDGVAPYDAATLAINNHDKLVELAVNQKEECVKIINQLNNLSILDVWTCCKLNDMVSDADQLLKELGHEI